MKLQAKVIMILLAAWLVISLIVFMDSKYIIAQNYHDLEKQILEHRIQDAKQAFDKTLYSLSLYTVSWSQWDGSYRFMKDENEPFIKSTFIPETYTSSKLNFILFCDANGKFYYGRYFNAKTNQLMVVPKSLLNYLSKNKEFVTHKNESSNKVGIVKIDDGLIVMCSRPIIKSNGTGPIRGSILMGYYLNDTFFNNLSDVVGMRITFFTIADIHKNNQLEHAYIKLNDGREYSKLLVNDKLEYGYVLLKDIDSRPVGMVRIQIPRMVYQQGLLTIYHYFFIVILSGLIVIILMWYLLKVFVLNRVLDISKQVSKIDKRSNFNKNIVVSGNDELSSMVVAINNMLNMISASQKQLHYLATHDALTGLPNRTYFYELLNHEIELAKANQYKIAVMFLDMDKLKSVNDNYGHSVGDRLIKEAADRVKRSLRASDVLARQSGDEFIIFMAKVSDLGVVTDAAKRILKITSDPFKIDDTFITVTFSIGISIYPDDGDQVEVLLKHADDVMYAAKLESGNNYQYFNDKDFNQKTDT